MTRLQECTARPVGMVALLLLLAALGLVARPSPADAAVAPAAERPAVFRDGTWYLRTALSAGASTSFRFGTAGDHPVMGDWDRDGRDTAGVFRTGTWYLRNANSAGSSTGGFRFGLAGDQAVAGDWNGDGRDTIGVFRNGTWYLRNANSSGPSTSFRFGLAGDQAVVGDWNRDGRDTIGVFRNGTWYLRNSNSSGPSTSFRFGLAGDVAVTWAVSRCSPAYPGVCIPPPPPDLNCDDISYRDFRVRPPDPHRFDGDHDGIGCET